MYPLKKQNTLQTNALSSWQSHPSWSGLRRPPLPSILNVPLHRLNMTYFHFKKQSRWPKCSRKKLRAGWSVHLVFRIHGQTLTKLIKRKYVNRFCHGRYITKHRLVKQMKCKTIQQKRMNFRWEFLKKQNKKKRGMQFIHYCTDHKYSYNMGLDARNPVFGGLWTTQAQTSLRICAVWSAPFFCFLESIKCKLAAGEISIFKLVSLAEETGLKHSLSKQPPPPPPENSFSHNEAHMIPNNLVLSEKKPKEKR